MKAEDLLLGFTQHRPDTPATPVRLDAEKRRKTHMLVVGSPGSGKSKFLEWMIRGDIRNRQGLCLIDPHGELYDNVLRWCSYNHFLNRKIILIDPSRERYITGFNPFQRKPGMAIDVQVNGMVAGLVRVWGGADTNQTPTLDRVLRLLFSAMVTLSLPLHEAHELVNFSGRSFRTEAIERIADPFVRSALADLNSLGRKDFRDDVLSTQNRLFKLVTSSAVRRFMGLTGASLNIDLASLMDEGAIILVNLQPSRTLDADAAKAFGTLLLNDLFRSAMVYRGKATTGKQAKPFYVYVDEWQTIATPDIRSILDGARKFGLNLVLANQDPSQIAEAFSEFLLDGVMSTCTIKACFGGLGERSAQRMARDMLVGQIDLNEEKYVIESTKFWPRYTRDVVRTHSRSRSGGTSHGRSSSSSVGWGDSRGTNAGRTTVFDEDGQGAGWSRSDSESGSASNNRTAGRSETDSESDGWADGESVADVPILIPEAFSEVTSRVVYTLEEQLWRWAGRLSQQYERHCFLKLPGEYSVPLLVPVVRDYWLSDARGKRYETVIAKRAKANVPGVVDRLLEEQAGRRRQEAHDERAVSAVADDDYE